MLHDEMELAGGGAAGGGGCCCAARAFPSQAHHHDVIAGAPTEVQRIMLRFRPIAPRPAPAPATGSGGASPINPDDEGLDGPCVEKKNRKKRSRAADGAGESRRTRSTRTRRGPKPKQKLVACTVVDAASCSIVTTSAATTSSEDEVAFAGQRWGAAADPCPEAALKPKESRPGQFPPTTADLLQVTAGSWERPAATQPTLAAGVASHIIAPTPQRPICSVITVVASTAGEWDDDQHQGSARWLLAGCGEWDAKRLLKTDARPSVVSDRSGKVVFANAAYRRMVGAVGDDDEEQTASSADERAGTGLVTGGGMRTVLVAPAVVLEKDDHVEAFSCRVKVRWCGAGTRGQPDKGSVTAPCDVWRLAGGSLAWRIDIGAALSLGLMGR